MAPASGVKDYINHSTFSYRHMLRTPYPRIWFRGIYSWTIENKIEPPCGSMAEVLFAPVEKVAIDLLKNVL